MSEERFKQIKDSIELQKIVKMQMGVDDELLQEEVELLKAYEKLKDNWNNLKKYIGSEWYCFDNESVEFEVAKKILNKMKELEQGSDNK